MPDHSKSKFLIARNLENDEKDIIIIFNLYGKTQKMVRIKNQPLSSTLMRILVRKNKILKENRKSKIFLIDSNGDCIDNASTNLQGFKDALKLVLDEEVYEIYKDNSLINTLQIKRFPTQGLDVGLLFEASGQEIDSFEFRWFRDEGLSQTFVGSTFSYVPTSSDVGHHLLVRCFPKNSASNTIEENYTEAKSKDKVLPSQDPFLFQFRGIPSPDQSLIRVTSYNILAHYYTTTETAHTVMYASCLPFVLHADYRHRILLKELNFYNSDIYGLQEVEKSFYESSLFDHFSSKGYNGSLFCKTTSANEGAAIFYRLSRFSLKSIHEMEISSCLETHPSCQNLKNAMLETNHLSDIYVAVTLQRSVFQAILLHDKIHNRDVLVLNTHLYFAPEADVIRLVQTCVILNFLSFLISEFQSSLPAIIMTGDWNSVPDSAAIELILTRHVQHNAHIFPDPNLASLFTSNLFLFSASGFPEYSTWVDCFSGLLDYVFIDGSAFDPDTLAFNIPDSQIVLKDNCLPASHAPSDHLPVLCDVKYKSKNNIHDE